MKIQAARFLASNSDYRKCPSMHLPEYAFIGRSNVGKSSLLNALMGQRLAHISSSPGRTQTINHYLADEAWYMVDLPGYGYAKTSKEKRQEFAFMTEQYLLNRDNLLCTFVLVDLRIEPRDNDLEFIRWMGESGLAFAIVFTKADKLGAIQQKRQVEQYRKLLLEEWEELPQQFVTSAETGQGLPEIIQFIKEVNRSFHN